jgi:DNA polymerase alpha subunit A
MKKLGMSIKTNDTIPYVICVADEGTANANLIASRARHPDEVKKDGSTMKIGMSLVS